MNDHVQYKGEKYRIKYKHERVNEKKLVLKIPGKYNERLVQATTTAYIISKDDKILAEGKAHCIFSDQFNKKLGRTISTGRLLKHITKMIFHDAIKLQQQG